MEYGENVLTGTGEVEMDPNIVSEEAGKLYTELQVSNSLITRFLFSSISLIPLLRLLTGSHPDARRGCRGVSGTHICVGARGAGQVQNPAEGQGGGGGAGEKWARTSVGEVPGRKNSPEGMSGGGKRWCLGSAVIRNSFICVYESSSTAQNTFSSCCLRNIWSWMIKLNTRGGRWRGGKRRDGSERRNWRRRQDNRLISVSISALIAQQRHICWGFCNL